MMQSSMLDQLTNLVERGGWVMLPLLALSVVSLAIILERSWFWLRCHNRQRKAMLKRLNRLTRSGDTTSVRNVVKSDSSIYGVVVRHLLEQGAGDASSVEAVEMVRPRCERFMTTLSTIITAAPLLGILGTVVGIIQSFELLGAEASISDQRQVSAAIAQALLTTALGLVVALVTLFPYMTFRGQLDRALGRLESLIAAAQEGLGAGSNRETGVEVVTEDTSADRTSAKRAPRSRETAGSASSSAR